MQTKTTTYAHIISNNNCMDLLCNINDRSSEDSRPFTPQENEIYKALCRNTHDSIWGEAIKLCVKAVKQKSDYKKFRDLIKCLREQANDNPGTMKNILGEEGYSVLMGKDSRAVS